MQLHSHGADEVKRQVHLSLLPDFQLNLKATSLLGSRAKLQGAPVAVGPGMDERLANKGWADIPKLEQLVIARLRQAIQDRLVWPRFVSASLPRLVARGREPTLETEAAVVSAASEVDVAPPPGTVGEASVPPGEGFRIVPPPPVPVGTPSFPGGFGASGSSHLREPRYPASGYASLESGGVRRRVGALNAR